jgi:hypothetical protein
MRKRLPNRKKRQPEAENEEREAGDDKQYAGSNRNEIRNRLAKNKELKCTDDQNDRQQVAQAAQSIVNECYQ